MLVYPIVLVQREKGSNGNVCIQCLLTSPRTTSKFGTITNHKMGRTPNHRMRLLSSAYSPHARRTYAHKYQQTVLHITIKSVTLIKHGKSNGWSLQGQPPRWVRPQWHTASSEYWEVITMKSRVDNIAYKWLWRQPEWTENWTVITGNNVNLAWLRAGKCQCIVLPMKNTPHTWRTVKPSHMTIGTHWLSSTRTTDNYTSLSNCSLSCPTLG